MKPSENWRSPVFVAICVRFGVGQAPRSMKGAATPGGVPLPAVAVSVAEIAALAKACGVSAAYLVEGTGPEPVLPPETGRDRAQPVTAQERRDQILEAATVLIARRGYHNVRVSDIARYCGTSTATVIYHFPSKEATLHAALEYYAQRFRTRLDEEFGRATSARDKLRRLIEVQLPLAAEDIDEWSVWIQFWNQAMLEPRLRPAQRRIYSGWYRVAVDVLHECRSEGLAPGFVGEF
jgi:AcrR family transcriptional regulator